MANQTIAQLLDSTKAYQEKLLQCLAILASGQMPDGTAATIGAGAPVAGTQISDVSDRVGRLLGVIANLPAAAALTDAVANPTTAQVGAAAEVWSGAVWERSKSATAAPITGVGVVSVSGGTGAVTSFAAGSTAVSNGTVLNMGSTRNNHIMVLLATGPPASGTVQLQGSLDGVSWYNLGAPQSPLAVGVSIVSVVDIPAIQLRAAITIVFAGGAIEAKIASSS